MSFSLKISVLVLFAALFLAGCTAFAPPGNKSNVSLNVTKPVDIKQNITCADNTYKVANGSTNTFNSSKMVCKNDCARVSSTATCDPLTCLCKTETKSCTKNSLLAAVSGKNSFSPATMYCKDDCASFDPTMLCDAKTCTCKKNETKKEEVFCVNITKETALTGVNPFDNDTMLCRDDCARLGPDVFCDTKNCTCKMIVTPPPPKIPCAANTLIAPIFGNIFNPATMICQDNCVAAFGADWKCDVAATCTCSKKPPEKVSCIGNSFANAFGAPNTFNPANMKCEDDCKNFLGQDWTCDGKTCLCEKKPKDEPESCFWNAFAVVLGDNNTFNPAKMKCSDDCLQIMGSDWYCDAKACECKEKPKENQTQSCSGNTLTINYGKGPLAAGTQCKDDCKTLGSSYVCDIEGCFCKETRVVTPRCGDGYVSGPNTPGGGFEECDVGFGFYQPKDAAGNPITKPDTCPPPKVCDARSCKCLTPVTENYTCAEDYGLIPGSSGNVSVPDSFFDVFFCVEIPICGDGKLTGGEKCDWNSSSTNKCSAGNYCTNSCECKKLETSPRCGDGKISVETGEQCDGGSVNTNICQPGYKCYTPECACVPLEGSSQCGDGTVVAPEECDHGNTFTAQCPDALYCSSCKCQSWAQLSHTVCDYAHGQCVNVQGPGTNECTSDSQCEEPFCGNGVQEGTEECDGNDVLACDSNEYCSNCACVLNTSTVQYCGNGVQEGTEECDGNDVLACDSNEYCSSNCQCVLSTTTVYYHFECQQNACVQVEGSGQSECNSDDDCVPPVIDCPAYCSGQGYSQSLGGGYSSASQCQAAASESQVSCQSTCIYTRFYSTSNQAGTATCCCKAKYTYSCSDCPGQNPYCPQCPDTKPS